MPTNPLIDIHEAALTHFIDAVEQALHYDFDAQEDDQCNVCDAIRAALPEVFRLAQMAVDAGLDRKAGS